jgi:hypothetical protein
MAVVQGIKEKVHLPVYDCVKVEGEEQLRDVEKSSTLKFFVDVQGKTKLETNLLSASLLPHYNTFEARALRVVVDVLQPNPESPDKEASLQVDANGKPVAFGKTGFAVYVNTLTLSLDGIVELLRQADQSNDGTADILPTDSRIVDLVLNADVGTAATPKTVEVDAAEAETAGGFITLSSDDLQGALDDVPDANRPLDAQVTPNNGSVLGKLIYNTVTTLYVGEKVMIEMPTWFFPAGAGPYSESGNFSTHGEPNPTATFRFAEPIFIDKQQNFRVEIDIPDADVLKDLQRIYGPLFIWVVLDGYMTRGVQ